MSDSDSSTSSDDDLSDDLNARIAKYSNVKSKPIGQFETDSDSDDDSDDKEDDEESNDSDEEEDDDDGDGDAQTESFNVSVRVRPLFSREKMLKYKSMIRVNDDKYVTLKNPEVSNKNDYLSMKRDRQKRFCFDNVFDRGIPTAAVYKKTVRRVIRSILEGYNATVFAYGATGSGKTYTMLGSDTEPGVMVHTLRDLFKWKEKQSKQYTFRIVISFLEIYNENIRDLLVSHAGNSRKKKRKYLDLRETPKKGVIIAGITFKPANDVAEVMDLLNLGNKRRTVESTAANKVSSRSHAVLQIYVERKSVDVMDRDIRCGKLNLIDLAGSEKGSVVKSGQKSRMAEGANINKSLLALSKCINALVDKKKFIPFRDSKLTRMLQDALGGNCKTVMICNISPSSFTWDDTHNTLKYADRAKNIRIKKAEINKMKNENKNDLNIVIESLKSQVNALKTQLTVTEKEKKMLKRKSKLIIQEKKKKKEDSLGLLSRRDMDILSLARDKLKQKMMNLEDLHARLADLNEEETNLIAQEISMKQMLQFSMNSELHEKYKMIVGKLSDITLDKMEIEGKIKSIASNTDSDLQGLVQRSHSKHLHSMIQKENELFRAQIENKTTNLNMSFMENKYLNQENEITKLQQENLKKHEDFQKMQQQLDAIRQLKTEQEEQLQEQMSFYKSQYEQETQEKEQHFQQQLNDLKQQFIDQETRKQGEQQEKEEQLQKQLTFYQKQQEEERQQNEAKHQQELEQLKQQLMAQQQENEKQKAPQRKANIKPNEIPYTKWDRDDVYYWIVDELCIDEEHAKLIYDEGFDGESIADIQEHDLKEIGITKMGVRRKIVRKIDLLQQKNNLLSNSASTLADSVAWNSMYKGIGGSVNNFNFNDTDSVFSDLTSVSQMDAKRQMRMMQDQLKHDPTNAENPQFMLQMMQMFASSQQLLPQLPNANMEYNNRVSIPAQMQPALPEEKEVFIAEDDDIVLEEMEVTDEMEEKAELPLTETAGGPNDMMPGEITPMHVGPSAEDVTHHDRLSDDAEDNDVQLMKAKQQEAKKAVNALAHTLRVSMTKKQMEHTIQAAAANTDPNNLPLTPGYRASEYDINFGNDDDGDSDADRPFDYDEEWMFEDKDCSFNLILLSPYKSLRKSFLKFCFEPDVIRDRKRTLSYKRYEKSMKCGDKEFIFRVLECYESNYIPDLFDNQIVSTIFMIFPFAITADNALDKETEFMQDLDTWMLSSGHWDTFWSKTVRMLDGSLSFKKHTFKSKKEYFESNDARKRALNDLFNQFNVDNVYKSQQLKWLNIETNPKTKLKIKENKRKYKFKWPHIPKQNDRIEDEKEDWRSPLTLKVFNALNEPNKSYFLTAALYSPQRHLIAPTFLSTAQSVARNGPYGVKKQGNIEEDEDEDCMNVSLALADTHSNKGKKKKKHKNKKKGKKSKTKDAMNAIMNAPDTNADAPTELTGPELPIIDGDLEASVDGNETMRIKRTDIIPVEDEEEDMDVSGMYEDYGDEIAPANDTDTMKINRNDFDMEMDFDLDSDTMKINRNELKKSKSIELRQAQTDNVVDTAATLEDNAVEPYPLVSAPPMMDDDDELEQEIQMMNEAQAHAQPANDEQMQKQLMQEAFAKFQEKRNTVTESEPHRHDEIAMPEPEPEREPQQVEMPVMEYMDNATVKVYDEMPMTDDLYKPPPPQGPPPPQYDTYQISAPPRHELLPQRMDANSVTPPVLDAGDGDGDVTPPVVDDFIMSPSPFPDTDSTPSANANLAVGKAPYDGSKRRVSKAYHGYQPSWAIHNKLHNQFSYYQAAPTNNYFDQIYPSDTTAAPYGGSFRNSIYGGGDDSDDDIDEELDFRKTKSTQSTHEKRFSKRYVSANRNQSIMRYQDILDQSTKAVNDIRRVSDKMMMNSHARVSDHGMNAIDETDDFAPVLLPVDAPIIEEKRVSKYMKSSVASRKSTYERKVNNERKASNLAVAKKKQYNNEEYANYSAPVEQAQSVSSAHSYSGQRQFGASAKGKRKKSKGSVLKQIFKWSK